MALRKIFTDYLPDSSIHCPSKVQYPQTLHEKDCGVFCERTTEDVTVDLVRRLLQVLCNKKTFIPQLHPCQSKLK